MADKKKPDYSPTIIPTVSQAKILRKLADKPRSLTRTTEQGVKSYANEDGTINAKTFDILDRAAWIDKSGSDDVIKGATTRHYVISDKGKIVLEAYDRLYPSSNNPTVIDQFDKEGKARNLNDVD